MTKDKAKIFSLKDVLAEIDKGPDYMKKVVLDFKKDCETLLNSMVDLYNEHTIINNFCKVSFKFELHAFDTLIMRAEVGTNCKRNNGKDTFDSIADVLLEDLKNAETEDNIN